MLRGPLRRVNLTPPSRRQILAGAGGMAVWFTSLATPALADTLTDEQMVSISAKSFTPFINQYFLVDNGDSPEPALKLVKVVQMSRGTRPTSLRNPFSLILTTSDDVILAAQTYEVLHPGLGWMTMFLSPISPDLSTYEAAFN